MELLSKLGNQLELFSPTRRAWVAQSTQVPLEEDKINIFYHMLLLRGMNKQGKCSFKEMDSSMMKSTELRSCRPMYSPPKKWRQTQPNLQIRPFPTWWEISIWSKTLTSSIEFQESPGEGLFQASRERGTPRTPVKLLPLQCCQLIERRLMKFHLILKLIKEKRHQRKALLVRFKLIRN